MKSNIKKRKIYSILNVSLPIVMLLAIVIVYAIVAKVTRVKMLVPSIPKILDNFFDLFTQAEFYKSVGGTIGRAVAAYLLAIISAVALTALTKAFSPLRKALTPIVVLVRILPTISIILLALIWFNSRQATIFVAYCVIFPMLYTSFCDAIENVDKDLIEMSKVYGVDNKTQILRMYVPEALPTIFTGLKSTVGLNLKLVIAAEVLAQTPFSMGVNMQLAKLNLDIAILMAWTLVALIIGGVFEGVTLLVEKKAVKGR
ncbi:MAG: ABC transporter permease subunit [Clostridia bacterium]|nr:ABC transporter permease subunit [Clostridia bacterium]MDE7328792.1 ABC transporter permease subunit [Clostridia bacterium]